MTKPAPSRALRAYAIGVAVLSGAIATATGILAGWVAFLLVAFVCLVAAMIGALAFPEVLAPVKLGKTEEADDDR